MFHKALQSAPIGIYLTKPIVPPNIDDLPSKDPNKSPSLAACQLCDQHQSCLERNASLQRSGYLYHKIILSRKNLKLPAAVSHHRYLRHVHCPQLEISVWLLSVKLRGPLSILIDAPTAAVLCNIQELRRHVSWGKSHLACTIPNCSQNKLDLPGVFWSACPSAIEGLGHASCLCCPSGLLWMSLFGTCSHLSGLCCLMVPQAISCPCPLCLRCLRFVHAKQEWVT